MIQFLARLVPRRFRSDVPVVPVVRISGVIGVVTPLQNVAEKRAGFTWWRFESR